MKDLDVTELPEEILLKSKTYRRYVHETGICSQCFGYTSLLSPCCGRSVFYKGDSVHFDDLWDEIEADLAAKLE